MSEENVRTYFAQFGLENRVVDHQEMGDTVEHAAKLLGCQPKEIAKAMTFLVEDVPVLITMAGDAKVDNHKFKAKFHTKAKMIPKEDVETRIGHLPGAVCPFAVDPDVRVYLDESLKRFDTVYTAGGSTTSTIGLSIPELETYAQPIEWVDVGKNWQSSQAN